MRRVIAFPCDGATLFGTIDAGDAGSGLLIVSGGNEIRAGAHRGQARLAAEIAAAGFPVLRYDRRGVGDSEGDNRGFESAGADLAAAAAAFRREAPQLTRILGFGNCDGASTLALGARAAGIDLLALANPWVIEAADGLPPPAAIRARYAERLRDPAEWKRLLIGGVDLGKLARGIGRVLRKPPDGGLAPRIAAGMRAFPGAITLLTAARDNTAIAFIDSWKDKHFDAVRARTSQHVLDSASHSFATHDDHAWLRARLLEALRES